MRNKVPPMLPTTGKEETDRTTIMLVTNGDVERQSTTVPSLWARYKRVGMIIGFILLILGGMSEGAVLAILRGMEGVHNATHTARVSPP